MLKGAVRILAVSQQAKARTDGCSRIDLDMRERAFVPLATLPVALKEGAQWSGAFRWNIMALAAVLIIAVDSPGKCRAYLGSALKFGLDPNEAHVTSRCMCISPAS